MTSSVKPYVSSGDLEREYLQTTSLNHRKKFAQFFTPPPVAELMAKWLLGNSEMTNVLEPAFGLGIFSRVLLNHKNNLDIQGFEVDAKVYEKAQSYFKDKNNVQLHLEDYIYNDWANKYDGIICNPPYFKFHDYDNIGILHEIEEKVSCKLSGFTNLYTLFLLKSLYQLKPNGRAAYIVPSEFLNSDYGKQIKSYLIKNRSLRHIIIIDFEENMFDDVLTTASILLFANDDKAESVHFSTVKNLSDLHQIEKLIVGYPNIKGEKTIAFDQLTPEIKWRAYYQQQNSIQYQHLIPFSSYGKVVRGIATGANDYFTFNHAKAKKYRIEEDYLLPCICKATDVKGAFFTGKDFEELKKNEKLVFLFNARNPMDTLVEQYLQKGMDEGIHQKHLTANRNPWFSLEYRPPSPIWVSVFNRNGLRFIRNEAGISNLTTFHCIYLNMFSLPKADLLFAYLLTNVSRDIFEDNRREYGNGLKKFEPNDINGANMVDLGRIDDVTEKKILELYNDYRQSELGKSPVEKFLTEINHIFAENYRVNL